MGKNSIISATYKVERLKIQGNAMGKKIFIILGFVSFCFGDNFIIDTHSIRDFELLLKPNQTLMINHKTGKLIGILEQTPDGRIKKLPIPQKWFDKNKESAFRLKNYQDSTPRQSGGLDSMKVYEKNEDYKEVQEVRKLHKQESAKAQNKQVQNNKEVSGAQDVGSFKYENKVRPTSTKNNNTREWDKSKIIYEQKSHNIELHR